MSLETFTRCPIGSSVFDRVAKFRLLCKPLALKSPWVGGGSGFMVALGDLLAQHGFSQDSLSPAGCLVTNCIIGIELK